jgi:uncharacterized LabA/DUF88 family protein
MLTNQVSKLAIFIDADNLPPSAVDWVFEYLLQLGILVSIRRAYGGHEKLSAMKDALRQHAVRSFVNQGKGTTDVALVVDVMDLLHRQNLPAKVAIMSSDADFAPLAVRLREEGIRVTCFAKLDNSNGEALLRAYNEIIYVDVSPSIENITPAIVESRLLPQTVNTPASCIKSSDTPIAATEDIKAVKKILASLPDWLPDTIKQLNQLGTALRDSGIAKGSKPLHELFRKHPLYFKVLPTTGPAKQVRLLKMPH